MPEGSNLLAPPNEKRSLKEQEFLAIRHALPKTRVNHTILHENPSQDRHLSMKLATVWHRRNKVSNSFDLSRRTFIEGQARKQRKWKKEDDMRRASMNFPHVRAQDYDIPERPASIAVVYNSPQYPDKDEKDKVRKGPLLPYMTIRREKTEILTHRDRTVMMKLPTVIEVDDRKLKRYNTYCGTNFITPGVPVGDERFAKLAETLSPRAPTVLAHRRRYAYRMAYSDSDSLSFSSGSSSPMSEAGAPTRKMRAAGGGHSAKLVLPVLSRSRTKNKPPGGDLTREAHLDDDTASSLQLHHTIKKHVK